MTKMEFYILFFSMSLALVAYLRASSLHKKAEEAYPGINEKLKGFLRIFNRDS